MKFKVIIDTEGLIWLMDSKSNFYNGVYWIHSDIPVHTILGESTIKEFESGEFNTLIVNTGTNL